MPDFLNDRNMDERDVGGLLIAVLGEINLHPATAALEEGGIMNPIVRHFNLPSSFIYPFLLIFSPSVIITSSSLPLLHLNLKSENGSSHKSRFAFPTSLLMFSTSLLFLSHASLHLSLPISLFSSSLLPSFPLRLIRYFAPIMN